MRIMRRSGVRREGQVAGASPAAGMRVASKGKMPAGHVKMTGAVHA
jgi:hypothetical protein